MSNVLSRRCIAASARAGGRAPVASYAAALAVLAGAVALLLLADVVALSLSPSRYHVDLGDVRSDYFLTNAHQPEVSADGRTYRWTRGESTLRLGPVAIAEHVLLTLELGGRPAPAELELAAGEGLSARLTAGASPRRYTLLLPHASALADVRLRSPTFTTPGDPRPLGVTLDGFALVVPPAAPRRPPVALVAAQALTLLAVQLTLLRLGWRWPAQALALGLLALGLALVLGAALLLAGAYLARLLGAAVVLGLLTWAGLPLAERRLAWAGPPREIRLLWALALAACAIRLAGALYPTFGGQDLGLNLRRLNLVIDGQMTIIANSSEFGGGRTIYPPGPYLAVMPGLTLIGDLATALQGTLALLDGSTAFLAALLARRLGGGRVAARIALLLYGSNIAAFGALTYGFSAQVFGQWFTAPIALLLLSARPPGSLRVWALALVLLLVATLSHIGVAILGFSWIGILLLLLLLRPRPVTWQALGLWLAGGLLAYLLLYSDIFGIMLGRLASHGVGGEGGPLPGWTPLIVRGAWLAFSGVGLGLLPLGALLIARARLPFEHAAVALATLLTVLLYLLVDLATAYQVRYVYFGLPVALAAIALPLGRLARRGRAGRPVVWLLVAAIVCEPALLWFATAMGAGKISLTPLTH